MSRQDNACFNYRIMQANFPQSEYHAQVQRLATSTGFKRTREQDGGDVRRVHYEHPDGYGFYIWEYQNGGWDMDYGYAAKHKLPVLSETTKQLQSLRGMLRAAAKGLIILDSKD